MLDVRQVRLIGGGIALLAGLVLLVQFFLPINFASGVEIAIDASIDTGLPSHNGSSPTVVFISDQVGFVFYRDSSGSCVYSKTTSGGGAWGSAVIVDAQTDCSKIAVWYDRWTPGDTTGTYIHIATMDVADLWYTRLDTAGDTLTTTVNASSTNQAGGFAVGANIPSITKGTDGDLYMGAQDTADSFVIKCVFGSNCAQTANWTEAGTNPFDLAPDWLILMPLSGGNIMAIRWDVSADDVQSKVYNDSGNSWDISWTTIDANAVEDSTYDGHFGATLRKSNGDIYLAYLGDVGAFGTDDDIRTAAYSSGAWASKTDILTNNTKGLTGIKLSFDENINEIYAIYTARATPGSAGTGDVYWKKSTDDMTTWGAEQGPINTTTGDLYGARVNAMSGERIYVTWDLASTDDLLGNTIADLVPPDTSAPDAVLDLALSSPSDTAMTVSWTAPGDDGSVGTATSYDLRYSTSTITSGDFGSATQVSGEPTPSAAGSLESMSVNGLSASTTYFFAIKSSDEVPNESSLSNVPSLATVDAGSGGGGSSGGGSSTPQTSITFAGRGYPGSTIELLRKNLQDEIFQSISGESGLISADGTFEIIQTGFPNEEYYYALQIKDKDGRKITMTFDANLIRQSNFSVKNIFVPPTIGLVNSLLARSDGLQLKGFGAPGSAIEMEIDGILQKETALTGEDGYYTLSRNVATLSVGTHYVKVRQVDKIGKKSGFSVTKAFKKSLLTSVLADFTNDGHVNIADWSVFLFRWESKDQSLRSTIDLDANGIVDIFDLSAFLKVIKN